MELGFNENLSADGSSIHSNPWSSDFVFESPSQRLIAAIVTCLVTVIGIPGNSIVILAVMVSKKLQNKTNVFVVNLACADMLTCAVLPFQALSLLNETLPMSPFLCQAVTVFVWLGLGSSVISLTLIAFTRYSIITRSRGFTDQLLTKGSIFLLVCVAWFVPLFFVLVPPAVGVGAVGYSQRYKLCVNDTSHPLSYVYGASTLIVGLLCLVVIIMCYFKIFRFLKKSHRNLIQSTNRFTITEVHENSRSAARTSMEVAMFRRQVEVTKNLFIVVCTYIICVMPLGFVSVIPVPSYPLIPWTLLLLFMNSCLNPIIYLLKHPQFKEVFYQIITCSWGNIPEPSSLMTSFSNISN